MHSSPGESRILDATKCCCERWGVQKVTVDDIATEAGVSRATLYRLFPGGKDVLFEALHARERAEFFDTLTAAVAQSAPVDGAEQFEDLLVRIVVTATQELRADSHLALMLASEPGSVLTELTVGGLPQIIRVANDYLGPVLKPHLDPEFAEPLIDLLVRITISYFLAPSDHVDLADPDSARAFLRPGLAALSPAIRRPT